ncbi:hypothetical protein [Microbacterium sp. A84]|uniref:hypothetical protein n=1 Tax=Microbacterium sp. A84 TaxID=3450715 RepID=UPI003F420B9D
MNLYKPTVTASIALLAILGLGMAGCSSSAESTPKDSDEQSQEADVVEEAPEPVDLVGEWKQMNSNSADSFQTATITVDVIEVFWNAPDSKSLYWSGTIEVPEDGSETFSWDSVNDTTKTDSALLASGDTTKTFTYDDGEISYEVTALGTTTTVRLATE